MIKMYVQSLWAMGIIIILGIIAGLIRYFIYGNPQKHKETSGEMLVNKIATHEYPKNYMPNDYDEYPGELEKVDTEEYMDFVDSGILKYIK